MMRLILVAWLVFLCCLSMAPFEVKIHLRTMGRMHNAGHVLAFLITILLFGWSCRTYLSLLLRCALSFGVALATEWFEYFRYRNPYEWSDIGHDSLGISIGFAILMMWMLQRDSGTKRTA